MSYENFIDCSSQNKNKIFITSALPYVNASPHLGNIISSTLSGDIYARFKRSKGHEVIYLCGTDEYGSATTVKAKIEDVNCQELCDIYHLLHKQVYDWFNIQFDVWGRTTTELQTKITHEIFLQLYGNGLIEEKTITQLYCDKCQMFLPDRYVRGQCYYMECIEKNVITNGDQCDQCQKLIDVNKLINPFCYICRSLPKPKETTHLFLKLQELATNLDEYLSNYAQFKPNIMSIANSWLKNGLISRCITRDLNWGTAIPVGIDDFLDKYKNKVFYVWFDAPFGYYSILANNYPKWREWLLSPNLEWIATQGKDNVPFHTIFFPASILGSQLPYPLINKICGTEYLLYEGKKFCKGEGIGIFGTDAIEISNRLGINEDYWRFYLVKIRPETQDSSFSLEDFASTIKADLINNIGNFINRCASLSSKYCDNNTLIISDKEYEEIIVRYEKLMDDFKFRDALKLCLNLSSKGNNLITLEQPWVMAKADIDKAIQTISKANTICWILLKLLLPFIPKTVEKVMSSINCDGTTFEIKNKIDLLFKKIDYDQLKNYNRND
jgi:methionyl-tRNA synthetase